MNTVEPCQCVSESFTSIFLHLSDSDAVYILADISSALFRLHVVSWGDSLGIPCSDHSLTTCSTRASCVYTNRSACHFIVCWWIHMCFFFCCFFMPLASFDCLQPVQSFSLSLLFPVLPVSFQLKLLVILNVSLSVVPLDWGGRPGCLVMAT